MIPSLPLKIQPLYKLPVIMLHNQARVSATLKFYGTSVLLHFLSKCQQHDDPVHYDSSYTELLPDDFQSFKIRIFQVFQLAIQGTAKVIPIFLEDLEGKGEKKPVAMLPK